jgi:hypothetical protein
MEILFKNIWWSNQNFPSSSRSVEVTVLTEDFFWRNVSQNSDNSEKSSDNDNDDDVEEDTHIVSTVSQFNNSVWRWSSSLLSLLWLFSGTAVIAILKLWNSWHDMCIFFDIIIIVIITTLLTIITILWNIPEEIFCQHSNFNWTTWWWKGLVGSSCIFE